jgi:hypothetical protein
MSESRRPVGVAKYRTLVQSTGIDFSKSDQATQNSIDLYAAMLKQKTDNRVPDTRSVISIPVLGLNNNLV